MRAGDCWIIKFEHSGPKAHLWFLLVDPQPDGLAVIASVTTLRHNADRTVILQPGEHPFVRHPSFVLYSDCQIINVPDLQKWIETGLAVPNDPFQPEVINEIQRGALLSDFTARKIELFVKACLDQKLKAASNRK